MDRLDAMAVFVAVAETGSLAAAARKLGLSSASVTRAVSQLETLGLERLLERSTRRLSITEAGQRHLESYRTILAELAAVERRGHEREVTGSVVVTAPELFGRMHVLPVVEDFLSAFPRTQVRLLLLNRVVDLVGEGVDVGIRLANLADSSLSAIKVGEVRSLVCASPDYLAKVGVPDHPSDLAGHGCIGLNEAGTQELWRYRDGSPPRTRSVKVTCRLSLNSAAAGIEAARRGLGVVRPLSYQVERYLSDGSLVAVLEEYRLPPVPVNMVFQSRGHDSSPVRAFLDHATPLLRGFASR